MSSYKVEDVLEILQAYYITNSKQMVTRYLREGKIKGTRTEFRKDGWIVEHDDLFDFIDKERPGLSELKTVCNLLVNNLISKADFQKNGNNSGEGSSHINKDKGLESKLNDLGLLIKELREENEKLKKDMQHLMNNFSKKEFKNKKTNLNEGDLSEKFQSSFDEVINEMQEKKNGEKLLKELSETEKEKVKENLNRYFIKPDNTLSLEKNGENKYSVDRLGDKKYKNVKSMFKAAIKEGLNDAYKLKIHPPLELSLSSNDLPLEETKTQK